MSNTYKIHDILNQKEEFLVVGLTGRMGSGCSKVAQLLETSYEDLKYPNPAPQPGLKSLTEEERAIRIIAEYTNEHWLKFDVIQVGALIATFIFKDDRRFIYDLSRGGNRKERTKLRNEFRGLCLKDFCRQLVQFCRDCKLLEKEESFYIREFTDPEDRKKAEIDNELKAHIEIFPDFFMHHLKNDTYRGQLKNEVLSLGKELKRLVPGDKAVQNFFKSKGSEAFLTALFGNNDGVSNWKKIGKNMDYLYCKVLQRKQDVPRRKYLERVDRLLELFSCHCLVEMLISLLKEKHEAADKLWQRFGEINQQVEPNAGENKNVLQIQKFVYVKYLTGWFGKSIRSYVIKCLGDDAYARLFQRYGQMIRYYGNILPYGEKPQQGRSDKNKKDDIFAIPRKINQYIKVLRHPFDSKEHRPVRVAIDSIKNIFEAVYLRYRYSAFYLWAITTDPEIREQRLRDKHLTDFQVQMMDWNEYPDKGGEVIAAVEKVLEESRMSLGDQKQWEKARKYLMEKKQPAEVDFYLDNLSNRPFTQQENNQPAERDNYFKDYEEHNRIRRGFFQDNTCAFYTQDIDSCICNADVYLFNNASGVTDTENNRKLIESVVRYVSLVMYPCLVRPTPVERCMQIAFSAKVNSGCLSRQVGAVVTDAQYNILAIGWNDVPCGEVPCAYKNLYDVAASADRDAYSEYELHNKDFRDRLAKYPFPVEGLRGLPLSYCFKNFHKDQKDPMRSRAMHAEEKALALCGQEAQGGYLFTTSSPCEMCSKNAKNHRIRKIFYLEAYPGISQAQYTNSGNKENRAELILFSGAVGRAYMQMYTPLLPHKDVLEYLGAPKK